MIKLMVALGNPDRQYLKTRHNIAWQFIEQLSFYGDLNWQNKFKGEYASKRMDSENIYFLKPLTYMNRSGESVQAAMHFFKIKAEEMLVIHDDLEMDFGEAGFKKGGGLAGHNGLRSIASSVGTKDFYRFRLGISRPKHGNVTAWVLGNFSEDESMQLYDYLNKAAAMFEEDFSGKTSPNESKVKLIR